MTTDVSFLNPGADPNVEVTVPLAVTGTCSGREALLQQVIILLFSSDSENARYQGGNLLSDLQVLNAGEGGEENLKNAFALAMSAVKSIIQDEQQGAGLPAEQQLDDILLQDLKIENKTELYVTLVVVTVEGEPLLSSLSLGGTE